MHHEVIHIDDEPPLHEVISEDVVHEYLKDRQRIAMAKEHHHGFIEPTRSSESGLPLVSFLNPNVVIPPLNVQFNEILEGFQGVDEVGDVRKGISILDGVGINILIVLAGAECAILLRDKEEEGHLQRPRRDALALLQVFVNEHSQGIHLLRIE